MSEDDQKIARTIYRQKLLGESFSTSAQSTNVMPDGMRNVKYSRIKKAKSSFFQQLMVFFGVVFVSIVFAYMTLDSKNYYDEQGREKIVF